MLFTRGRFSRDLMIRSDFCDTLINQNPNFKYRHTRCVCREKNVLSFGLGDVKEFHSARLTHSLVGSDASFKSQWIKPKLFQKSLTASEMQFQ